MWGFFYNYTIIAKKTLSLYSETKYNKTIFIMKRVLLLSLLLPLFGMAQSNETWHPMAASSQPKALDKSIQVLPAKKSSSARSMNKAGIRADTVGTTTFDVQTNASIYRKTILHPGGKVGVVWTYSSTTTTSHLDRGTGYNSFDGTSWSGANTKRFEPTRAGYNSIASITKGGVEQDLIVSHKAASTTTTDTLATGGSYFMTNGAVGSSTFSVLDTLHMPNGPMWTRVAVSGDYIHVIGTYASPGLRKYKQWNVKKQGVWYPTVYSRYKISTGKWDQQEITLPGYDFSRYFQGSSDDYSIDARGSNVSIIMGGFGQDVALWKSKDDGNNWSKTILDSFKAAPYNPLSDDTFGAYTNKATGANNAFRTNDGSVHVIIDSNNVTHTFWPISFASNSNTNNVKDSVIGFYRAGNGILYYNDNLNKVGIVASTPEISVNTIQAGDTKFSVGTTAGGAAAYTTALCGFPTACIDDSNYLYLFFSAYRFDQGYILNGQNFRHIWYRYSKDGGKSWSDTFELSSYFSDPLKNPNEEMYASVSKTADANIHISWMRDDEPGNASDGDAVRTNYILCASIPVAEIKSGALFQKGADTLTGINQVIAPNFSLGNCYPNPANTNVNIPMNLVRGDMVSVKVTDMLGREVYTKSYGMLPYGRNNLSLDVCTYSKGVYFYTVKVGINSLTSKMIVE